MGTKEDERRRDERRALVFKVALADGSDAVCETQDVSVNGAFLRTDAPLSPGAEVCAEVSFPGFLAPCTRRGVVRWARDPQRSDRDHPAGFGVEWTESPVDDPLRRALGEMRDVEPTTSGARILVAEDNEHILQMMERMLPRGLGGATDVSVETAADGEQAWDAIERGEIDLAILDVYMPGLDGLEVLARVRDSEDHATLPVVVISAAGKEARARAYAAGADFFMDKPLRLLEIVDTVRTLLRLPGSA